MRRHAIITRLGPGDTTSIDVGQDIDVSTEVPFLDGSRPATERITHELLYKRLTQLGITPPEIGMDLLVLAVTVFAADTRIDRTKDSQNGWTREIDLHIPVSDPQTWIQLTDLLSDTLRFLSGDHWRFYFRQRPKEVSTLAPEAKGEFPYSTSTACLFSGGLDSFIGALDLLEAGIRPILVGHHKSPDVNAPQERCFECIREAYSKRAPEFINAYLSVPKELFSGEEDKEERARSFLFLSLGVMVAASLGKKSRLVVPENGLISLNVPLTPLRLGALSTRTTHPHFMKHFQTLVDRLGLDVRIENPYQFKTKGEMLRECRNQTLLKKCISQTMSCAHPTAARYQGGSPTKHCGRCVPCLIRRAAIQSAFRRDQTDYTVDVQHEIPDADTAAGRDVRALQIALARLNKHPELANAVIRKSGPLSTDPTQQANFADVYRRGMHEVANLLAKSSSVAK